MPLEHLGVIGTCRFSALVGRTALALKLHGFKDAGAIIAAMTT